MEGKIGYRVCCFFQGEELPHVDGDGGVVLENFIVIGLNWGDVEGMRDLQCDIDLEWGWSQ